MRLSIPIVLSTGLLLAGCANLSPLTTRAGLKPDRAYWAAYDSSRRGAYLTVDRAGRITGCAEPAPDTAFTFKNTLDAAAKTEGGDANAKVDLAADALALAGRDRTVLIVREVLFRLCEADRNGSLRDGEVFDGFQEVVHLITVMAEAERARAIEAVGNSAPDAAVALSKASVAPSSSAK